MQQNLAIVSLKNVRYNAACISRASGNAPLFAIVKDDAYGHGAVEIAHALDNTVKGFAVATVEEGAYLRAAGIQSDILVLTPPTCGEEALRGGVYGLILTVSSLASLSLAQKVGGVYGVKLRAHLAVNTGMNRLGFRPERVKSACKRCKEVGIYVEGIYSHLYAPANEGASEKQRELFLRATEDSQEIYPKIFRHLSATGGILLGEKYRFDGVRSGIGLYGYLPNGFENRLPLKPAMKVYSTVVQSGKFIGGGVGYASATKDYGNLKTLRLGYGDGFFRAGMERAIGNLCMDAHIREGESRLGRRELVFDDAEKYARERGTIVYEALLRMGERTVKRYVN